MLLAVNKDNYKWDGGAASLNTFVKKRQRAFEDVPDSEILPYLEDFMPQMYYRKIKNKTSFKAAINILKNEHRKRCHYLYTQK